MNNQPRIKLKNYTEGWTSDEIDFLIANYRRMSKKVIAHQLMKTKNAVIGKAYRLGLTGRSRRAQSTTSTIIG